MIDEPPEKQPLLNRTELSPTHGTSWASRSSSEAFSLVGALTLRTMTFDYVCAEDRYQYLLKLPM